MAIMSCPQFGYSHTGMHGICNCTRYVYITASEMSQKRRRRDTQAKVTKHHSVNQSRVERRHSSPLNPGQESYAKQAIKDVGTYINIVQNS